MGAKGRKRVAAPAEHPHCFLALDVSSVCVGWALFRGAKPVKYGKYLQVGKDHGTKLAAFEDWLLAMLAADQPDGLVVEAPYAGRRRFTFGVLMMYFGVVQLVHVRWKGVELPTAHRIAAHQVKRLLEMPKGATHAARKEMMVERINQLYHLKLVYLANNTKAAYSDDDTADAIAAGLAFLIKQGQLTQERT